MFIVDFGFGDFDTDAVRPFLLMFLVGVASVGDRSIVLVVPNVFFGYFCVCSLSSSNAVTGDCKTVICYGCPAAQSNVTGDRKTVTCYGCPAAWAT